MGPWVPGSLVPGPCDVRLVSLAGTSQGSPVRVFLVMSNCRGKTCPKFV